MQHSSILITGGAGFVGSRLALALKRDDPGQTVTCLDNLRRRGSELSLVELARGGVTFVHGDMRNDEDLAADARLASPDVIIDCSAEPSVSAGATGSPRYVLATNLVGTVNCLELARRTGAAVIFLSTSRVYPMSHLRRLSVEETESRFWLTDAQPFPGVSSRGVSEAFPLDGARSLYGATKLASELLLLEYADAYGLLGVVNRCGVIAGPGQMGRIDQGVVALWAAQHHFMGSLAYIGFGGTGKQVRDILHVDDLYAVVRAQLSDLRSHRGATYNIGGGAGNAVSLRDLTMICEEMTGNRIPIGAVADERPADIPIFVTDGSRFAAKSGVRVTRSVRQIVHDVVTWIRANEASLKPILAPNVAP